MASKSDSPNMVAHPGNYVKVDVIFREGAACFKQALALPFRARSGFQESSKREDLGEVGNCRTVGRPLPL